MSTDEDRRGDSPEEPAAATPEQPVDEPDVRDADEVDGTGDVDDPDSAAPVDPLDLTVPVASLPVTASSSASFDHEDGRPEQVDDARSSEAEGTSPASPASPPLPGTWPGPGTGAVPLVVEDDDTTTTDRADHPAPVGGWRALGQALRPRANRSQLLAAVLCAALGFALVVQVQQSAQDPLSSARQDDLVRLLDEVTQRSEQLAEQVAELSSTRDELRSGTGQAQAAVDLAEERASAEGILSGRLPAVGPGLEIVIRDPQGALEASTLFNVLEELRNAGAEVVELNDVRLVTSTWFRDTDEGVVVDGELLDPPYRWTVIGDPATLSPALEIPGGALATVRTAGAEAATSEHDEVEVDAVREPTEPRYAIPERPEG